VPLLIWQPEGVFDEELGNRMLEFMEREERTGTQPFHRYADLTRITDIRLRFGHTFQVAERRKALYPGKPVKAAIYCEWVVGYGLARMYEALMEGGPIEVRVFRERDAAAEWLGVPLSYLDLPEPPPRQGSPP
jgi:hypothetical protein